MTDEKIDRILANDDELIPSSGFVSSVMERIREESTAPPPIPFPWKRIVPGFVLTAAGLGWGVVELTRQSIAAAQTAHTVTITLPDALVRSLAGVGWTAAALAISLVSWALVRRAGGDSKVL